MLSLHHKTTEKYEICIKSTRLEGGDVQTARHVSYHLHKPTK